MPALSYSNVSAVDQTETAAKTAQVTKLFLSPDVQIRPGARITVTQAGITRAYECSGDSGCLFDTSGDCTETVRKVCINGQNGKFQLQRSERISAAVEPV